MKVLLLYPIMRTGNKVCKAVNVLIDHKVPEKHIILINLFCTPDAAKRIVTCFPNLNVLTTELHQVTPNHFGERYFGTEDRHLFPQPQRLDNRTAPSHAKPLWRKIFRN